MIHIFPAFQHNLCPLLPNLLDERFDAVVQDFVPASLDVNRWKAVQVGPEGRNQGRTALCRAAEPVCPQDNHALLDPVEFCIALHAWIIRLKIYWRRK
jgi:hypothetical protein